MEINTLSFGNIFKNKKILITGDTGFKGSWLAMWLVELGADVYGYALPPKSSNDNFIKCKLNEKIKHENGDVRDLSKFKKFFKDIKPEIAFHLAAQSLVLDSYRDTHCTFDTNIMGTVNFFEAVRETESLKVAINITSDKCYRNNEWIWAYREIEPMGGNDPYSASKGCSELITASYINSFFSGNDKCCIASARAGNVLGGGDWASERIVPDYFRSIAKNEKLILRNPYSIRPWQHVLEPLSGYLMLAWKLFIEGNDYSGAWNFGPSRDEQYSVKKLIDEFVDYLGQGQYEIQQSNDGFHEANLLGLDISKALRYLKWKPVLNFRETVEFTVDGYIDERDNKDILYYKRVKQINQYTEKAKEKEIVWSK